MPLSKNSEIRPKQRRSLFETFLEVLGWLQIFASPFIVGCIIGAVVYFAKSDLIGLILAIAIVLTGIIIGAVWATKVWRKRGAMHFMSRIMATPELDPPLEESK